MNSERKNPLSTVDIIIEGPDGAIVLIKRKNAPPGWALPGGFVDYGESVETAAVREAKEETSLEVTLIRQLHTYSAPERDPRFHTISVVFYATAKGTPVGKDDALEARFFKKDRLPSPIAFDHAAIIEDFFRYKATGEDAYLLKKT
ncbi:MAG: NUDIX hydrolase [Deltaproteobacteria bacterium]|nr:NUDIX hydrolase [Deltaproteobacteria bacterium]